MAHINEIVAQVIAFVVLNWQAVAGVAVVIWLLYALAHSAKRRDAAMRTQMQALENALAEMSSRLHVQAEDQAARNRELIQSSFLGFNDSVVKIIGEMSRTQQGQLDSFGGQIRATGRNDEERMERMRQTVEQRMETINKTLAEGMTTLQTQNQQKLEEMRLTVDEKLHTTLDRRLGESFQLVSERLEQVSKGLGEMQTLASGVGDLKKVLTNVKTRGTWGEVQLGSLLEQILAPSQYRANVAVRPHGTERVEYAVVLPGRSEDEDRTVYLPIDAKFPQEDYLRLVNASERADAAEVEAASKAFDAAVRLQARRISEKYVHPPYTTDYAIMFLPTEGLYAEVLRGPLAEQLQQQYRVIVTGPTTLAALLNSLQMGFKTLAIERRSSEVWSLLSAVKTEFGRFADLLSRTQKKLRQASDSIEDAARKTRTIQRKLHHVSEMPEQTAVRLLRTDDEELESENWEEPEPDEDFEGDQEDWR